MDKKVVWEYDCANSNGNKGKRVDVHAFARLPNGNTRIVESKVGRVIEVDRAGKLVHSFPLKPALRSCDGRQEEARILLISTD